MNNLLFDDHSVSVLIRNQTLLALRMRQRELTNFLLFLNHSKLFLVFTAAEDETRWNLRGLGRLFDDRLDLNLLVDFVCNWNLGL